MENSTPASYETTLQMAASLSREERLRLIEELAARSDDEVLSASSSSILELCGLGKDVWEGIDPQEYVREERASWNG